MGRREDDETERRRVAREVLAGVDRDGEIFASSALSRAAGRVGDHFSGRDGDDRVEIWGKRIGRGLGLVFALGLVVHLVATYGMK